MPIPLVTPTSPPPVAPAPPLPRLGPQVVLEGNGRTLVLEGSGYAGPVAMTGVSGIGLPPSQLFAADLPDGSAVTGVRLVDREVFVPVLIGATDYASLRTHRETLHGLLDPKVGPVTITVRQPDTGSSRSAEGFYVDGMEGNYGRDVAGHDWQTVGLSFRCPDPLAYGDVVTRTWAAEASARPFLSTTEDFFPVILGSSLVGGVRRVLNAGEVDAWPVTTVTGPGSDLILENLTTGASFTLSGAITQPLTIDARRGVADVYDEDGDLWDRVELGSSLFSLAPGYNDIQVTLTGADEDSSVSMSWRPPYRSLH